jgi:hypothetical protein
VFSDLHALARDAQGFDGVRGPGARGDDDGVLDAARPSSAHRSANSSDDSPGFSRVLTVFWISS